ncbi:hypothetical protein GI374_12875 [Paracoccus sp. S-4012]|uniref:hypothetical protein n=1 Tax=Paracoccus sp. S-4012 TaxID=2665648 RepID=UPI0012AF39B0|nr:hypothetical protein [Paracoccus sp. S-4012]MRX51321.1 hypothetical protein [Paracoccus sp. S-4012]
MNLIWLLRASRWARNPPSARTVMLVFGAIAIAVAIAGADHFGVWPEWAQMEPQGRRPHLQLPPAAQR